MAYIASRPEGRFELRHSAWTASGPRSKTLASFSSLDQKVIEKAVARGDGVVTRSDILKAAKRAGVRVSASVAEDAATRLLTSLDAGDDLDPTLARLLADRLATSAPSRARPVTDAERAAGAWLGRSLEERGEALRDLLLLADRLPQPKRASSLRFPVIDTASR